MAVFQPKFVDLVRNLTTTTGTADFVLGPPVNGFTSFLAECQVGDRFYYSAIGIDRPTEREVGRGTLLAGGVIGREPTDGAKTNFSAGTKVIALIAAAEWFARMDAGATASTRAALAGASSSQGGALLCEPGREGQFVWTGSNVAALVAADSAQGIYVAPASDPSGASGAWVRRYSGPISVKWFGAKGDGVANDGAAFVAAIAFLKASAVNDVVGYYKGSPRLFVPAGIYNLGSTTLDVTHTLIIEGEGSGHYGGYPTQLVWSGATGIRVQDTTTTGGAALQSEVAHSTYSGSGTTIRGLALFGGYSGTEAEDHGIQLRSRATIEDVFINGFEGDGIHIAAAAPSNGNCNGFQIHRARIQNCRNGVFCDLADSNAGLGVGIDIAACRQWGIWDSSFLGNTWIGCEAADCGVRGPASCTPCYVSYGGHWYSCVVGQEANASSNAPSGTAADNGYWLHLGNGGPDTTTYNVPAWTSGIIVRAGGAYCSDNPNAGTRFISCYVEGGQGASQLASSSLADGGNMQRVVGAQLYASLGKTASRGYHRIESATGGAAHQEIGAGDDAQTHLRTISNPLISPWTWYERLDGNGNLALSNLDSFVAGDNPYLISHPTSSETWGPGRINFRFGFGLGDKKVRSAAAAPTTGAYMVGDMVFNSAPSAGGKIGWVCTGAGSPGTWKAFGLIDA